MTIFIVFYTFVSNALLGDIIFMDTYQTNFRFNRYFIDSIYSANYIVDKTSSGF